MHTQKSTLNCIRKVTANTFTHFARRWHLWPLWLNQCPNSIICFHSNLQGDNIRGVMGTGVDFGYTQRLSSAAE